MDRRMINGLCHNPLNFCNNFLAIDSSRCAMSSFYNPSELFPLSTPPKPTSPSPTSSSSIGVGVAGGGSNYIEHPINKFDTLAGLAIKYGVEVAAIKKLNGLVTDHQMFARKTLHIPLDGRHPPIVSDASDTHGTQTSKQSKSVTFESFRLGSSPLLDVPPAMTSQQGYYGLEPAIEKTRSEGSEMGLFFTQEAYYQENGPSPSLSLHRKCKSVAYDLHAKNTMSNNGEAKAPETVLKEEVISGTGFSLLGNKASKGLALRNKSSVARTMSEADKTEEFQMGLGNSTQANVFGEVRRSSSTPSLQDAKNGTSSSSWWNLKPDWQARSTSSATKPIFDGLPNPITGKKSKAAID